MNDIVSQLRTQAYELEEQAWGDWAFKFNEAADEIERLRGMIDEVLNFNDLCDCDPDAKDRGEMCDSPFVCFDLRDKLEKNLNEMSPSRDTKPE